MLIRLDNKFKRKIKGAFEKYEFEVGILENKSHREPVDGTVSSFAGGPVRRASRSSSGMTVAEVSRQMRAGLGFNYLTEPFRKKSSDIIKFSREFLRLALGRSQKRRAENLLQAIVRNPILRGDYGSNSPQTQKAKGFDRLMIDTGQLFKSIRAKVKVRGV